MNTFPGVYEAGAVIANNTWFHARLEIDDTTVRVFVNEGKDPVLVVKDLKLGDHSGLVGFWGYPGAFANLKITPRNTVASIEYREWKFQRQYSKLQRK